MKLNDEQSLIWWNKSDKREKIKHQIHVEFLGKMNVKTKWNDSTSVSFYVILFMFISRYLSCCFFVLRLTCRWRNSNASFSFTFVAIQQCVTSWWTRTSSSRSGSSRFSRTIFSHSRSCSRKSKTSHCLAASTWSHVARWRNNDSNVLRWRRNDSVASWFFIRSFFLVLIGENRFLILKKNADRSCDDARHRNLSMHSDKFTWNRFSTDLCSSQR